MIENRCTQHLRKLTVDTDLGTCSFLAEIRRLKERLRLGYAVDDSAVASLTSSSSNNKNTATNTANKGKKRKKGEAGAEDDGDGEAGA